MVSVTVGGRVVAALVDTGCSVTLVGEHLAHGLVRGQDCSGLEMMNRTVICTHGSVLLESVQLGDSELGPLRAQVIGCLPGGVEMVLGLDVILRHGLRVVQQEREVVVEFGSVEPGKIAGMEGKTVAANATRMPVLPVEGKADLAAEDFKAWFSGGHWSMRWRWKGEPPTSPVRPRSYHVPAQV